MGALPRPDLQPGPARDLNDALHELHHRAGWPSLRAMARETGVSHTTVSHTFSTPRLPTWGVVELVVEALHGGTAQFHELWLAASTTATDDAHPAQRLAGRRAELTAVHRHLESGSGLLLVTGEAGIGKTKLVTTGAERAACFVATGHCLPLSTEVPLLPIADTLDAVYDADAGRWLANALATCPGYVSISIARLAPQAVPDAPEDVGSGARQRLFASYIEVVKALAATRRMAVLIEDLHWADTATLDLLEHALGRGPDLCWIATWRTEDESIAPPTTEWFTRVRRLAQVTELDLHYLDRGETAEQLALLGGRATPEQVERIHARSQGHPLFTEQLAAHLDDDQALPRLLLDLLDRRLAGLSGTGWILTRLLGIAARPLTADQLARAAGLDRTVLTTDLHSLRARRLVRSTGDAVELHHPLLAEATRRRLVSGEGAQVHRALAETLGLEPDASPAEVAAHWQGAGEPEQEIGWRVSAARDSLASYDWGQSAEQWLRVLELWPAGNTSVGEPPISRAGAYIAAMDALDNSLQWDRAAAMADVAEEELGEVDDAVRLELALRVAEHRGEREPAVGLALIEETIETYQQLAPSAGMLEALEKKRVFLTWLGRHEEARALARSAVDDAVALGDRRSERHHLGTLAWYEGIHGDVVGAVAMLEGGRRISGDNDPLGDIRQAVITTELLMLCGRGLEEVEEAAREGFRTAQAWGIDGENVMFLRSNVALARIRAGRIHSADELIAVTSDEPADPDRSALHLVRAVIEALGGQLDVARERIDSLWREVRPGDGIDLQGLCTLADVHFWNGTPDGRLAPLLQDLDVVVDSAPVRLVCAALVSAARAAGEVACRADGSSEHLPVLRDLYLRAGLDPGSVPADTHLRAHALAGAAELARGDGSETVAQWVGAAAEWEGLARPHDAAYCRWRGAQVALREGQGTIAARLLRRAATDAREHVPLSAAIARTGAGLR